MHPDPAPSNPQFVEEIVTLPSRNREKQRLRSQIRSLERSLSESSAYPGQRNTHSIDMRSAELALKSSKLVLNIIETQEDALRALSRKGKDARILSKNSK